MAGAVWRSFPGGCTCTHVAGFNVAINDKARYQDPNHALWGMGLSYGYAFSWGKDNRWGIEFNIGVGFAVSTIMMLS